MSILSDLKKGRLYFDGGLGTLLQSKGLKPGELPELWNISRPEIIKEIHFGYLSAGSDIITTNTFGANSLKFEKNKLENIISAAIQNAKSAIKDYGAKNKYVALDIGPTGKLLKPLGDLDFEDAVSIFADSVNLGEKYGADLIIIETMNDSYETKAAVLAAKENCSLPIFVTNAYDESGKLMTGASPSAMVALLEGLSVDALGINCSLGPDKMLPIIEEILSCSSTPVIVSPNAGLPVVRNGKTEYDLTAEHFSDYMLKIAEAGAAILGGCCGTTPEYIRLMKEKTSKVQYMPPTQKNKTVISSYTHCTEFGKKPILIGERINPTGKPLLKNALREQNFDYILKEGLAQEDAGAEVLDVNVGLPEINEKEMLVKAVRELQAVTNLPLQLDTADIGAMEAALRIYNGKPLINSVNGKQDNMESILPLAAKYGGVIIALTLDESGIPESADGRIEIAEKIIRTAEKYGISKNNIIVDPLAMTVSSDSTSALTTLECIKRLSDMGIKTSLGVSNVSFGLPQRDIVNSAFFVSAMQNGLSAAIMNPHSRNMTDAYYGYLAIANLDPQFEKYIGYASAKQTVSTADTKQTEVSDSDALKNCILKGLKDEAAACTKRLLKEFSPLEIIDSAIIPPLNETGLRFEKKTLFLPQLLMSAEAAKAAFEVIKENLLESGETREKKMKIVIATVKGDIHDIGKNIVKTLLQNYDFDVIDLGKDVPPETVAETVLKEHAPLAGLSALMTTTVPAMEETIKQIKEKAPECRVVVGGAVLTQEYADMIGADKYAKDAMETVRYAESLSEN